MAGKERRRRRKPRSVILKRLLLKCLAFLFSHVGVTSISIAYMAIGALVFQFIEAPEERAHRSQMEEASHSLKEDMWLAIRNKYTVQDTRLLASDLHRRLNSYKSLAVRLIRKGYDGRQEVVNIHWSYPGAFFYSMTTISTVGYGTTACRTTIGRAVTIGYAIFGIPLMLLFLAITGDTLSISCKFLYRAYVRLKIRILAWRHRKKQADQFNTTLSRMIREQLYHTAAMYGISPQAPPIDGKLLEEGKQELQSISVPVYVLIALMITYLLAGATLFWFWERDWKFGEAFYFCFISLALIGFGDLFPGATVSESWAATTRIIVCAFYLLFGMALIAMCFNLAQEDAIKKFRELACRIGLTGRHERRESKVLDPRDIILEGGPIGDGEEIPPLTLADLQQPLLKQPVMIPVYYGATGKAIRRPRGIEKAQGLTNGSIATMSSASSRANARRRQGQDSTVRTYMALAKRECVTENRRSL